MKAAYHLPGWTLLKSFNFKKATKSVNSTKVKTQVIFFSGPGPKGPVCPQAVQGFWCSTCARLTNTWWLHDSGEDRGRERKEMKTWAWHWPCELWEPEQHALFWFSVKFYGQSGSKISFYSHIHWLFCGVTAYFFNFPYFTNRWVITLGIQLL